MNSEGRQLFGADIKHFLMGGDAIFALRNTRKDTHMTFRVTLKEGSTDFWWISVLTGPDNTSNYTWIGTLKDDKYTGGLLFRWSPKSRIREDAPSVKTARWFFDLLGKKQQFPPSLQVWHEGRCCKCARVLSDPTSIVLGIGPVCRGKM